MDPLNCIKFCFSTCVVLECSCDAVEIISKNQSMYCAVYQYNDIMEVKNKGLSVDEFSTLVVISKTLRKHFLYAQVSFTHEDDRPYPVLNDSISYIDVFNGKNNLRFVNVSLPSKFHTFSFESELIQNVIMKRLSSHCFVEYEKFVPISLDIDFASESLCILIYSGMNMKLIKTAQLNIPGSKYLDCKRIKIIAIEKWII